MAVKIRLRRMGTNKKPFYRVVVADSRTPRDGRFIEILGYYNPRTEPVTLKIDTERAQLWLSRGAQPTDTAMALLKMVGAVEGTAPAEELVDATKAARTTRVPKVEAVPAPEPEKPAEPETAPETETAAEPEATAEAEETATTEGSET